MIFKVIVRDEPQLQIEGASFFGHDETVNGLAPRQVSLPAHLLLTVDRSDPMFSALNVRTADKLRLVYPFYQSFKGSTFSYRHLDGNTIKFETFDPETMVASRAADWPSPDFPKTLPSRKIDISAFDAPPNHYDFDDVSTIFIGAQSPTIQQHDPNCPDCAGTNVRLLAKIPGRPIEDVEFWRGNDFVNVLFWYCEDCTSIFTHNECD
jgi:hypothetical protein